LVIASSFHPTCRLPGKVLLAVFIFLLTA